MVEENNNSVKGNAGKNIIAAIFLLIPFIAYFELGTYDKVNPTAYGLPYFYWYQTIWLVISAILFVVAVILLNSRRGGD